MLAFRAALWKVMICGLACSVVASLTLTTSELLRRAAFGPLLTAVFSGLVVLVIGLFRLGWVYWFGRIHEKPNVN